MPLCTAHHPVYSTHLCELPEFHAGTHSTLYKSPGAKFSSRLGWEQAKEERDEQKIQDFLNADWEDQMHTQAEIDRASGIDFGSRHDRPQLLNRVRLIDLE